MKPVARTVHAELS